MDLSELRRSPFHLHTKLDNLAIGSDGGKVAVGGKPSRWLMEPGPEPDTFRIHSFEDPSVAWTAVGDTTPVPVLLLPPAAPELSDFRFVPVAGEEDTYEILHGPDKAIGVYKPNETGQQPLTLLGAPSACRILITRA
ncbi:hypothetical protein AB0E62_36200 [Streptomyces sp. NPDC038707]|uniref:hypothetical protein n=1 Tax=Streptomyces sp. NPDC038707 TaxID=3154329 RepID=UPI0033FD21A4